MAAHHHHHHHQLHHHNQTYPTTCCSSSFSHGCSFNCNSTCNNNQTLDCPSPPLHSFDPYIESHRFHGLRNPNNRSHNHQRDLLISSLVSRIEALEASLSHLPPPNRSRQAVDHGRYSVREAAARVIQTHFRGFLVRRSRTLGQLKDLAIVKSGFISLRSSISDESNVDLFIVSRKALDLLVKLDSIQCDDSMVRDGKRSLSRDLVRFMEFVEGVYVKRHELYLKARKKKNYDSLRFGQNGGKHRIAVNKKCGALNLDQREIIGKLKERVEKIRGYSRVARNNNYDDDDDDVVLEGFQHVGDQEYDEEVDEDEEEESPVVVIRKKCDSVKNGALAKKKSVSFAENKNVFKVFSNSDESVSNEDSTNGLDGDSSTSSSEDQNHEVEEIKVVSLGIEEVGDEDGDETEKGSSQRPKREIHVCYEGRDGEFLFSPPLPVQMEEKADLSKRRNEAKILR